jgi:hypothetical protein
VYRVKHSSICAGVAAYVSLALAGSRIGWMLRLLRLPKFLNPPHGKGYMCVAFVIHNGVVGLGSQVDSRQSRTTGRIRLRKIDSMDSSSSRVSLWLRFSNLLLRQYPLAGELQSRLSFVSAKLMNVNQIDIAPGSLSLG